MSSLRTKILISLLIISLLFGLGMVLFAQTFIYHKLHNKLREKGVALARRAAADSINPVITERYFEMTMMFKDMMASENDITYVFVLSEDGRELAHTFARGVPQELKLANQVDPMQQYSAKDLSTDRGRIHDIAVPLLNGHIGVLHLGLSDMAIKNDVNDIVMSISLFAAFVLIAGSVVSIGLSRSITRPLMKLASAAEAFGRGQMNNEVPVSSSDEIGELAKVFNSMVENRKHIASERELLIAELKQALSEVKTLRGFLPICAWCKKIRNDDGYWQKMETYISEHSGAEFSHGICPECAKKQYSEFLEEDTEAEEGPEGKK